MSLREARSASNDRKGVMNILPSVAYLTHLDDNRILPFRERILTHVRIELIVPSEAKEVCGLSSLLDI